MHNSQNVAMTIKTLAKTKKITIGQMLSDCDISKNTLSTMQSGGYLPRVENLAKIADYLDCSVDYLLGRTDNPEINKQEVLIMDNNPSSINFEKIASDIISKIERGNQNYLNEHPDINTKQYEESAKIAVNICIDILKTYHTELIKNLKPH